MELKLTTPIFCMVPVRLLIVPYGIETIVKFLLCGTGVDLLIVPYGIETVLHVAGLII